MSGYVGKFVWYELMTTDVAAAVAFYGSVLGWTPKPMGHYTMFSAGETPVSGTMVFPGAQNRWIGYVGVDDVDAFVLRVKAAGGSVHRAADEVPGVGRFAVVADPQNADFVLFTPAGGNGRSPAGAMLPGHVGWRELHADDAAAAFGFYADLFGWTRGAAHDMGPMGMYQVFATGGADAGGMMARTAPAAQPTWLYYFNVESIAAGVARVREAGGKVLAGPTEVPGGAWVAQCLDPRGAWFALLAPP
jgi:predicted enzyme related to lactoylglutathione lyase